MDGQYRIDSMYAFTMIDEDGTEGVIGAMAANGQWMPLVGADLARVESLRPVAQALADRTRKAVKLVHFSTRTEAETLEPR